MSTPRRLSLKTVTSLVVLLLLFSGWSSGAEEVSVGASAKSLDVTEKTGDPAVDRTVDQLLRPLEGIEDQPLPVDPHAALESAVELSAAELGVPLDAAATLSKARLPDEVAGRLALTLLALKSCGAATDLQQRRDCAVNLQSVAAGLARTLSSPGAATFSSFYIWPVLAVDTGANNYYQHDFALTVDLGGNDTYANNAGGNLLGLVKDPVNPRDPASLILSAPSPQAGLGAPSNGVRAEGCQTVRNRVNEITLKQETHDTGNFPVPLLGDCVVSQALLLDMAGNDTYGVKQSPDVDAICTADPLIRRIVLQGAGFEGVGMLIDVAGNDSYTAKTASQGSGHVGGVGVLRDLGGGNDSYLAIRNSQGFSLVEALGLLADDGGNDNFDFYMPSALKPGAAFHADGSGGVVDDTGLCDNRPRHLQGSALLGGIGILINRQMGALNLLEGEKVNDSYRAGSEVGQLFLSDPEVNFHHGSQGFGACGGVGILVDTGSGNDRYVDEENSPTRLDGGSHQLVSRGDCIIEQEGSENDQISGVGVFVDDGSKRKPSLL